MTDLQMVTVPGHPGVHVVAFWSDEKGKAYATYYGTAEALIAAEIVPAEALAPRGRTGKRPMRVDPLGRRCGVTSWWVGMHEGKPHRCFRVEREGPAELLPGAREAITEQERAAAERAAAHCHKPSHLRLVVDNTVR